jgi:hypothetical protein
VARRHARLRRRPCGSGRVRVGVLLLALCTLQACGAGTAPPGPSRVVARPAFSSIVLDTADPVTARYGFSDVDVSPSEVGSLGGTQRALVWLGGYDNATCTLVWSDDVIRADFDEYGLARSSRIAGYFLVDEPNTDGNCPAASVQVKARAALVRSLDPDPAHFTLANIDDPGQFGSFRGSVDVMSTDPYPCKIGKPCDWSMIPRYIAQLRRAGVVRYMGMLQAFSAEGWRWPTAAELARMITQWQDSGWCGEITFSWVYRGQQLSDHPDLLALLSRLNERPTAPVQES